MDPEEAGEMPSPSLPPIPLVRQQAETSEQPSAAAPASPSAAAAAPPALAIRGSAASQPRQAAVVEQREGEASSSSSTQHAVVAPPPSAVVAPSTTSFKAKDKSPEGKKNPRRILQIAIKQSKDKPPVASRSLDKQRMQEKKAEQEAQAKLEADKKQKEEQKPEEQPSAGAEQSSSSFQRPRTPPPPQQQPFRPPSSLTRSPPKRVRPSNPPPAASNQAPPSAEDMAAVEALKSGTAPSNAPPGRAGGIYREDPKKKERDEMDRLLKMRKEQAEEEANGRMRADDLEEGEYLPQQRPTGVREWDKVKVDQGRSPARGGPGLSYGGAGGGDYRGGGAAPGRGPIASPQYQSRSSGGYGYNARYEHPDDSRGHYDRGFGGGGGGGRAYRPGGDDRWANTSRPSDYDRRDQERFGGHLPPLPPRDGGYDQRDGAHHHGWPREPRPSGGAHDQQPYHDRRSSRRSRSRSRSPDRKRRRRSFVEDRDEERSRDGGRRRTRSPSRSPMSRSRSRSRSPVGTPPHRHSVKADYNKPSARPSLPLKPLSAAEVAETALEAEEGEVPGPLASSPGTPPLPRQDGLPTGPSGRPAFAPFSLAGAKLPPRPPQAGPRPFEAPFHPQHLSAPPNGANLSRSSSTSSSSYRPPPPPSYPPPPSPPPPPPPQDDYDLPRPPPPRPAPLPYDHSLQQQHRDDTPHAPQHPAVVSCAPSHRNTPAEGRSPRVEGGEEERRGEVGEVVFVSEPVPVVRRRTVLTRENELWDPWLAEEPFKDGVEEGVELVEEEMPLATLLPPSPRTFVGSSHIKEYTLQEKLGEGTFGVVWKGVKGQMEGVGSEEVKRIEQEEERLVGQGLRVRRGDVVALKQIILHNEGDGMPITSLREIRILKSLEHPNIVPVVDIAYEPGNAVSFAPGKTYMVFPYMDHDLAGLLENPKVRLTTPHIKQYAKQLLEGTRYLHRNGILHRDMKAANLLISNAGVLMIADFGLARSVEKAEKRRPYTNCVVTRWYRPPELLLGEEVYHFPVDMWGVGCVIAEMYSKKPIFPGNSDQDQAHKIFAICGSPTSASWPEWRKLKEAANGQDWGNRPNILNAEACKWSENADETFAKFIEEILVLDPKKRLTASQALDHEWLWSEPWPADPSSMPTHEASHEYDKRKREEERPLVAPRILYQQPPPQQLQPPVFHQQQQQAPFGYGGPPPPPGYGPPQPGMPFNGMMPGPGFPNGPPQQAYGQQQQGGAYGRPNNGPGGFVGGPPQRRVYDHSQNGPTGPSWVGRNGAGAQRGRGGFGPVGRGGGGAPGQGGKVSMADMMASKR